MDNQMINQKGEKAGQKRLLDGGGRHSPPALSSGQHYYSWVPEPEV